ncbi:hypothetical protein BOX15_Mlig021963g3 [Macrostomum lignano]|uniref:MACPF domain-containing protein n=2 Tax=Macrostomum lignano TaxID=282301 RepID=A0A267DI08_9PLAT|nr:hypothetical protein BOX15_Mlig021963g3 [Macrostomum lignano]
MYVSVIMYKISLDDVKPNDINFAALRDYMSLPESYSSVGAASKFQDFLLRWGTHFIRSGKFGGQLKITMRAKTNKFASSEEFASLAETEFQSIFSLLQSKYSQETTWTGFLGFGGKKTTTTKSSSERSESQYRSTRNERNQESHSFSGPEFTQTTVEAQGGTPEIAEALVDFYTPAFKELYHRWIASINDYVKPFEFKLKPIDQLFDMNMDDLFPAGNRDFGCIGSAGSKVNILTEPKTRRHYYLDEETYFANNKTKTKLVKIYCKYKNQQDFKNALKRRRLSLEKAVAAYMTEGPFPTSSHELKAGQPGCESSTLAKIDVFNSNNNTLTFLQLKKSPFLISFDLPQDIPNLLKSQAKYVMTYLKDRWFATEPGHHHAHLYEGCQLEGFKPAETKICIYEEETGFFHIDPLDFIASKRRNPNLPDWIEGTTVARASRIEGQKGTDSTDAASIPCNVRWLNSHRLDPDREENCLYFTAATAGDIFVIFASIPRDHTTWYYLQINMDGVTFYKAMKPQKRDYQKGMGTLGDKNLYQSYFLCVNQANGSVLMQFGKAGSNSEIGTVYSGYKFRPDSQYSRLSFYTFGAGSKSVSLMDIHLTKDMPQVECLNNNYKLVDGHCILDCHKECIDCNLAKDDTSCFQCRNVRVELWNSIGGRRVRTVQCLPECPVGYQLSDSKENLCVPCQPGTFKNTTGNHNCLPCAPGSFSVSQATVSCMLCSPGNFASKPGSVQCQQCHVGTASRFNGSASCGACSAGLFAAQRGQTECTPCPVGQFNKAERQTQCQLCSAGFFADKPGQKSCTACPAGTSSAEGSVSCANNCKRGEFSPVEGIPCAKCPAGSFTPSAGSVNCTSCAEGSYSSRSGSASCTPCPAGSFADLISSTNCSQCPAGSFSPSPGSANCIFCAKGSYSSRVGSASCTPCPRGFYQPQANQTHCKSSKPGWYVDTEGRSEQRMCPLGKYSGLAASECTVCPSGTFADQMGSTNCSQCPAGSWSKAGSAPCQLCEAGSFSVGNAASCSLCPAGTFSGSSGSGECSKCPAGTYVSESGAKGCHNCDLNFALKRRIGMAHCDLCPDSGSTFGTDKCYRKIRMKCDPSFDECEKTIDNDVNTYGVTIHILHAPAGTQEYRSHWQYTLDQVANKVKGFIVWPRKYYDVSSSRNLQITLYDSYKQELTRCYIHTDFVHPYSMHECAASNVKYMKINHSYDERNRREVSLAEFALYAG